ncbi:MAG: anti-sigma F factor [Clostridiaceae bacterium]|jgi:stage II sporulation protein AB (anti-sigma F factor)|nr:anti-sigma F factor [Clostridiaceae bacterium]
MRSNDNDREINKNGSELINEMTIIFPAISRNESFARVVAASFISQLDPNIEELADVRTAVSEAVTNSIIHGYENTTGNIKMVCLLYKDSVEISVIDEGKGIEDIELARQPLYTSKPDMERSGMGFTVMETFMDEVRVETEVGKGTKITMIKILKSVRDKKTSNK